MNYISVIVAKLGVTGVQRIIGLQLVTRIEENQGMNLAAFFIAPTVNPNRLKNLTTVSPIKTNLV
jgi:hypothetical protein